MIQLNIRHKFQNSIETQTSYVSFDRFAYNSEAIAISFKENVMWAMMILSNCPLHMIICKSDVMHLVHRCQLNAHTLHYYYEACPINEYVGCLIMCILSKVTHKRCIL